MKKYNTWEMLKELTECTNKSILRFFMEIADEDEPIICFINTQSGCFEFRTFQSWDEDFICDNPIIYPTSKWIEISKQEADIYLKGKYV